MDLGFGRIIVWLALRVLKNGGRYLVVYAFVYTRFSLPLKKPYLFVICFF